MWDLEANQARLAPQGHQGSPAAGAQRVSLVAKAQREWGSRAARASQGLRVPLATRDSPAAAEQASQAVKVPPASWDRREPQELQAPQVSKVLPAPQVIPEKEVLLAPLDHKEYRERLVTEGPLDHKAIRASKV